MKKTLFAALSVVLMLTMCSCDRSDENVTEADTEFEEQTDTEEFRFKGDTEDTDTEEEAEDEVPEYTVLWAILPVVDAAYFDGDMNEYNVSSYLDDTEIGRLEDIAYMYESRLEELSNYAVDIQMKVFVSEQSVETLTMNSETSWTVDVNDLPEDVLEAAEDCNCILSCANLDDGTGSVGTDYWGLTYTDKMSAGWCYGFIQIMNGDQYLYESAECKYPEEVWVHEWIHTLEGTMVDYCVVPTPDGSELYNYPADEDGSYLYFYNDILNNLVEDPETGEMLGMTPDAWRHVAD